MLIGTCRWREAHNCQRKKYAMAQRQGEGSGMYLWSYTILAYDTRHCSQLKSSQRVLPR
jgi:hypothetical protein